MTKKKVIVPVLSGTLASILALGWWFGIKDSDTGTQHRRSAFKGYESIENLSEAADVIVLGTVDGIAGHDLDRGIESEREPEIYNDDSLATPMVFYRVEVNSVLKGQTRGSTIIVATGDPDRIDNDSETVLKNEKSLLLFLEDRTTDPLSTQKFEDFPYFYVPLSLDSGVFDVLNVGVATPRLEGLFAGQDGTDTTTFTLDEIRDGIVNELSGGPDENAGIGDLTTDEPIETPVSVNN